MYDVYIVTVTKQSFPHPLFHSLFSYLIIIRLLHLSTFILQFGRTCKSMTSLQHDHVLSRKEQLKVYLTNDCRPDGREFTAVKEIVVSADVYSANSFGSALVKWGRTLVSCSVAVLIGTPHPHSPTDGAIVFDAGVWSISSSAHDAQRHKKPAEALLVEAALERLYARSSAVDLSQLCIEPGKSAFCLSVQVVCLSSDGSFLEACILAVSAALARTVLPAVSLDACLKMRMLSPARARAQAQAGQRGEVAVDDADAKAGFRRSRPLAVSRNFVALSLGVVGVGARDVLLVDPSLQEHEQQGSGAAGLLEGRVLVAVDQTGALCLLEGAGNMAPDRLVQLATACAREAQAQVAPLLRPLL